ncbi:hypothetical protein PVL29_019573 [Vitis rotundifolia]|uniref:Uncharacterized protein n=1 Tax=Vitis rotundifolia TaxID=103349 RepID=A0AA38Z0U8_VITRO|nr:hypothetical protein PVL29_019573 [Vitis rotundifolia]
MGLAPQHADQSLYGVPVSNIRGTLSQYSHMQVDRSAMQQNPSGNSSFPSNQYAAFLGQPSMEDGNLVSKQCFPRKKWFGQAPSVSRFFYNIDPPTGKRHAIWRRLQNDIDRRILELIYMQVYAPTTLAPAYHSTRLECFRSISIPSCFHSLKSLGFYKTKPSKTIATTDEAAALVQARVPKAPKSPLSSTYKSRFSKDASRTQVAPFQLTGMPEPSRREVQIMMQSELSVSKDSETPSFISCGNGKGSQIRKSLRTTRKLINGFERRNQQKLMEAGMSVRRLYPYNMQHLKEFETELETFRSASTHGLCERQLYSSLNHHRKSHNFHLFKLHQAPRPPVTPRGISFNNLSANLSSPPDQDRAGPSELQSFLESLKSHHAAIPMGYKEPKSTSMRLSNGTEQGVCSPTVAERISTLGAIHCFRTLPKSSSSSEERDSDCFKEIHSLMEDITTLEKQVYFLQKLLLLRHQKPRKFPSHLNWKFAESSIGTTNEEIAAGVAKETNLPFVTSRMLLAQEMPSLEVSLIRLLSLALQVGSVFLGMSGMVLMYLLKNKKSMEFKRREMVYADRKPLVSEANSGQAFTSQKNKSPLQQEILAHKRKAVSLKREGKLAEAREELRQAKLLEKNLEEDDPQPSCSRNFGFEGITRQIRSQKGGKPEEGNCFEKNQVKDYIPNSMGIAEKKMHNKDFVGAHPNVHYKCAGPPTTSFSTYPIAVPSMSRTTSAKPVASSVQFTPSPSAISVNMCSEQTNAATSSLVVEYPAKQETKTNEEMKVSISGNVPNAKVLEDQACISSNIAREQAQEDQAALTRKAWCTLESVLASNLGISVSDSNKMDATLGSMDANLGSMDATLGSMDAIHDGHAFMDGNMVFEASGVVASSIGDSCTG